MSLRFYKRDTVHKSFVYEPVSSKIVSPRSICMKSSNFQVFKYTPQYYIHINSRKRQIHTTILKHGHRQLIQTSQLIIIVLAVILLHSINTLFYLQVPSVARSYITQLFTCTHHTADDYDQTLSVVKCPEQGLQIPTHGNCFCFRASICIYQHVTACYSDIYQYSSFTDVRWRISMSKCP